MEFCSGKIVWTLYKVYFFLSAVLKREEGLDGPSGTEHIDDCGLRYHLAARHHVYLISTLSILQRARLQMAGLSPAYFVWAFHSEAEEVSKL